MVRYYCPIKIILAYLISSTIITNPIHWALFIIVQTDLGVNIFKLIQQVYKTLTVPLKYSLRQWKLKKESI